MQPPSKNEDDDDQESEETVKETLNNLRSALTLKGKMAQFEGRARLTKDDSQLSSEEYLGLKEEFENVDAEVCTLVESVIKQVMQQQRRPKGSNNVNNRR